MRHQDTFEIQGGYPLSGTIPVYGSKNAALKLFAASLLTDKPVQLDNIPDIEDVKRIIELITPFGPNIQQLRHNSYRISAAHLNGSTLNRTTAQKIRASIMLVPPLLLRTGRAQFPHPGGDVIGMRPIDMFLEGFKAFGGAIRRGRSSYTVTMVRRPRGTRFVFKNVSVSVTESMMLIASCARGQTTLINAACEPEIAALADFLNKCGARISGAGTPEIRINGVRRLHGCRFTNIPDRVETGSFAILAAATRSRITLTNCRPDHSELLWNLLRDVGARVQVHGDRVRISPATYRSINVKTHEYPGFPTDLQAPWITYMTQTPGQSFVHETIYEGRLFWTEDLKRMGAHILLLDPHRIIIQGPTPLKGQIIESPDIRAGMAFIIAALAARGTTLLRNVYNVDRGYERVEERLQQVGARIKRV